MEHRNPGVQRKFTVLILSASLIFMMMNTCPVRSILQSAFSAPVEFVMQNGRSEALGSKAAPCFDAQITEVSLFHFSVSTAHALPVPLLTRIGSHQAFSPIFIRSESGIQERKFAGTDSIPLFLKNRSIII